MDIIFNTIPSVILGEEQLEKVKKDCVIIDLASKPGGVDFEASKRLGIKTIWALALPGKVAPITAANIIKSTIFNMMDELGV
jgi:dipicolinate synthase subunit A